LSNILHKVETWKVNVDADVYGRRHNKIGSVNAGERIQGVQEIEKCAIHELASHKQCGSRWVRILGYRSVARIKREHLEKQASGGTRPLSTPQTGNAVVV